MTIANVAACLESFAPLSLQEDYDNAGLLIGDPGQECTGVLCTLDVTAEVVAEAVRRQCNCVVAHHPLIFRGLKRIAGRGAVVDAVREAIRSGTAVYACHTNIDHVPDGVNARIADQLGLSGRRALLPGSAAGGSGLIGEMAETLDGGSFLALLARRFGTPCIRHTGISFAVIRRVAVCGGAGSFLIARAIEEGADALVTADVRYHEFFEPSGRLLLCDIGHYESEQFTTDLFADILQSKFPTFAVLKSEVKTNPVHYFTAK